MFLNEIQWEDLIKSLYAGNCCLMIGPDLKFLVDTEGNLESVLKIFSSYLQTQMESLSIEFDRQEHDFYYRANQYLLGRYAANVERFFEDIEAFQTSHLTGIPDIFKEVAKLPFISICSMLPDPSLARAMQGYGFHFVHERYNYRKEVLPAFPINDATQLLYYLYGSYGEPESVAVTPQEQLELIRCLVAGTPKVPDKVKSRFQKPGKSFLFLGFDFNDWHYRLILKSLGIPKPAASYYPEADSSRVAFINKAYYTGNLGITFLHNDTTDFVRELARRYEAKYQATDRNIKIFIDYHPASEQQFSVLLGHLMVSCNRRNFSYLSKNVSPGDHFDADEALIAADVYIPIISREFLNSEKVTERIFRALDQTEKKVIFIRGSYANYQAIFGETLRRVLVLPEAEELEYTHNLSQTCGNIANTLNSTIR